MAMARGKEHEQSYTTMKSNGEALRLSSTKDIPEKAGSSNWNPSKVEEVKQAPVMVANRLTTMDFTPLGVVTLLMRSDL